MWWSFGRRRLIWLNTLIGMATGKAHRCHGRMLKARKTLLVSTRLCMHWQRMYLCWYSQQGADDSKYWWFGLCNEKLVYQWVQEDSRRKMMPRQRRYGNQHWGTQQENKVSAFQHMENSARLNCKNEKWTPLVPYGVDGVQVSNMALYR